MRGPVAEQEMDWVSRVLHFVRRAMSTRAVSRRGSLAELAKSSSSPVGS